MGKSDLLRQTILQILAEARTIDSMSFGSGSPARSSSIMPTDAGRKVLTLARQGEFGPALSNVLADEGNLVEVFKLVCHVLDIDPRQYKNLASSAQGMLEPGQEELLRKMDRDRRIRASDVDSDYDPLESTPSVRRYSKLDF